jgi:hypothetical protein
MSAPAKRRNAAYSAIRRALAVLRAAGHSESGCPSRCATCRAVKILATESGDGAVKTRGER